MIEPQQTLTLFQSRIEQLEERQNITAKYAVGVKRQLDELTEKFNELQQRFEQQLALPKRLDDIRTINEVVPSKTVVVESGSNITEITTLSKLVELEGNDDVVEAESDEESLAHQESFSTAFTDEEFKIERIMWLVNRTYITDFTEEEILNPPIKVEEFWKLYNKSHSFTESNLMGINLSNVRFRDRFNLAKSNLSGANLNCISGKGIDFSGANLKKAQLCEANLPFYVTGSVSYETCFIEANLDKANLTQANLQRANLRSANLNEANLSGANLKASRLTSANLRQANLSNANLLNVDFSKANLEGVNFQQACYNAATKFPEGFNAALTGAYLIAPAVSLQRANLSNAQLQEVKLMQALLDGANLSNANPWKADLTAASLCEANLKEAKLINAKLVSATFRQANLSQADFENADMSAVDLRNANLIQASFKCANLMGANLAGANLLGVSLCNQNLSGANLNKAILCGVNLSQANLSKANLTSADLRGADLSKANLEKANLKDANTTGVKWGGANLSGAIMPDGTTHE